MFRNEEIVLRVNLGEVSPKYKLKGRLMVGFTTMSCEDIILIIGRVYLDETLILLTLEDPLLRY